MHKFGPGTVPNPYQWKTPIKMNIFREKITCIHVLGVEEVMMTLVNPKHEKGKFFTGHYKNGRFSNSS